MAIRNSIDGALPELIAAEAALHAKARALGIDYRIADFGGLRTEADTVLILGYRAADYAAAIAMNPAVGNIDVNDWRPIAPFGRSYHNYGAAFDVLITRAPAGMSFDRALSKLKALAPSVGLRSTVPNDEPHFELPIDLDEAMQRFGAPVFVDVTTASVGGTVILVGILLAIVMARNAARRR